MFPGFHPITTNSCNRRLRPTTLTFTFPPSLPPFYRRSALQDLQRQYAVTREPSLPLPLQRMMDSQRCGATNKGNPFDTCHKARQLGSKYCSLHRKDWEQAENEIDATDANFQNLRAEYLGENFQPREEDAEYLRQVLKACKIPLPGDYKPGAVVALFNHKVEPHKEDFRLQHESYGKRSEDGVQVANATWRANDGRTTEQHERPIESETATAAPSERKRPPPLVLTSQKPKSITPELTPAALQMGKQKAAQAAKPFSQTPRAQKYTPSTATSSVTARYPQVGSSAQEPIAEESEPAEESSSTASPEFFRANRASPTSQESPDAKRDRHSVKNLFQELRYESDVGSDIDIPAESPLQQAFQSERKASASSANKRPVSKGIEGKGKTIESGGGDPFHGLEHTEEELEWIDDRIMIFAKELDSLEEKLRDIRRVLGLPL